MFLSFSQHSAFYPPRGDQVRTGNGVSKDSRSIVIKIFFLHVRGVHNISGLLLTTATVVYLDRLQTIDLNFSFPECPRQSGPSSSSADDNDDEMLRMALLSLSSQCLQFFLQCLFRP